MQIEKNILQCLSLILLFLSLSLTHKEPSKTCSIHRLNLYRKPRGEDSSQLPDFTKLRQMPPSSRINISPKSQSPPSSTCARSFRFLLQSDRAFASRLHLGSSFGSIALRAGCCLVEEAGHCSQIHPFRWWVRLPLSTSRAESCPSSKTLLQNLHLFRWISTFC